MVRYGLGRLRSPTWVDYVSEKDRCHDNVDYIYGSAHQNLQNKIDVKCQRNSRLPFWIKGRITSLLAFPIFFCLFLFVEDFQALPSTRRLSRPERKTRRRFKFLKRPVTTMWFHAVRESAVNPQCLFAPALPALSFSVSPSSTHARLQVLTSTNKHIPKATGGGSVRAGFTMILPCG